MDLRRGNLRCKGGNRTRCISQAALLLAKLGGDLHVGRSKPLNYRTQPDSWPREVPKLTFNIYLQDLTASKGLQQTEIFTLHI